jgi:hypothetical protein
MPEFTAKHGLPLSVDESKALIVSSAEAWFNERAPK